MNIASILKRGPLTTEAGVVYVFIVLAIGLFSGEIPWHPEYGPLILLWLGSLGLAVILSRTAIKCVAMIMGKELVAPTEEEKTKEKEAMKELAAHLQKLINSEKGS